MTKPICVYEGIWDLALENQEKAYHLAVSKRDKLLEQAKTLHISTGNSKSANLKTFRRKILMEKQQTSEAFLYQDMLFQRDVIQKPARMGEFAA